MALDRESQSPFLGLFLIYSVRGLDSSLWGFLISKVGGVKPDDDNKKNI